MSHWIAWLLGGVVVVMTTASLAAATRQRRQASGVFSPAMTTLQWLDPTPSIGAIGGTAYSRAVVLDQRGGTFSPQPTITYSSGTPANVTIDSGTGLCTAVANGTSTITAQVTGTVGGVLNPSLSQTATVAQQPASISGVSSTLSTDDASSGTFSPTAKDANNNTIAGATFAYSSANPSVITVNATSGAWAGQSAGSTTITIQATANGVTVSLVVNVTVTHLTYTLTAVPDPITGNPTNTFQLTVTENGVDVTSDSGTSYSTSDKTIATVDAPTLTSISPNTITQGTNASYTFTGTNIKGTETIGGLPTGVTASSLVYTSTTVVCTLTATGSATTGAASLTLVSTRGDSGTQTLTVNSSVAAPTLTSVGPTTLQQGVTSRTITLTGTNFDTNCTAVFSNAGVTVNSYGTITSTSLPVNITISGSATTGAGTVKVHQSGGGGLDSGTKTFTITASGTPAQLTRAWESDTGLDVATNGSGVGTWTDRIGSAAWTQATAGSKPTNVNATLNGLNVLQFSGAQTMAGTVASQGLNGTTHTFYILCETDTIDGVWRGVIDNADTTAHTGFRIKRNDSSQWKADEGSGTGFGSFMTATATAGQWTLLTLYLDSSSLGNNGTYVNGVVNSGGANLYAANTTVNPVLGQTVGDSMFKGKIAGIYVSTVTDSTTQRGAVVSYVNSKWGTTF